MNGLALGLPDQAHRCCVDTLVSMPHLLQWVPTRRKGQGREAYSAMSDGMSTGEGGAWSRECPFNTCEPDLPNLTKLLNRCGKCPSLIWIHPAPICFPGILKLWPYVTLMKLEGEKVNLGLLQAVSLISKMGKHHNSVVDYITTPFVFACRMSVYSFQGKVFCPTWSCHSI